MHSEQHTPGPWKLDENQGSRAYITVNAPTHLALASVVWQMSHDKEFGRRSPSCEANARLIASAPEMLEALVAIAVGSFDGASNYAVAGDWKGIVERLQAIAKEAVSNATRKELAV